jgi:hypothetical protein
MASVQRIGEVVSRRSVPANLRRMLLFASIIPAGRYW